MSPTEDYFFSNNISIWSHKRTDSLTWFNTQELEQAYYEKNEENYRRLREGY